MAHGLTTLAEAPVSVTLPGASRAGKDTMERSARRFLMTLWDGGGNVPPELGVARRLVAQGHAVHVLGDPTIEEPARAAGCTFSPWRRAPHRTTLDPSEDPIKDWETGNPLVMLRRVRDRFLAGPAAGFAADTADAIEAVGPHALVADGFLFGSIIAAQAVSVPVALLVPNIWVIPSSGTPPIGPGFAPAKTVLGRGRDAIMVRTVNRLFRGGLPALNDARAAHGLEPLSSFYDQALSADRILVLTSPVFDYAAPSVPTNVRYVGAILDHPDWVEPWTSPWPGNDRRPLVLVGFSSTYQNQGPVLRRVIEALSTLPVRAVVTVGRMLDGAEVTATDNVVVVASAPHGEILRDASLAVSHCGHGTTMKTLAAGVPMVCIPMGRDQNDTAARVVHHGAGVRLSPNASVAKIRHRIQLVLGDDGFRTNASRLGSAITSEALTSNCVSELQTLAGDLDAHAS
jgi:MGT family glycosyltransferase